MNQDREYFFLVATENKKLRQELEAAYDFIHQNICEGQFHDGTCQEYLKSVEKKGSCL